MDEAQVTTQETSTESPEAQAAALLNDKPEPTPQPKVTLPEGVNAETFNSALKQIVGIEDYTKLPETLNAAQQYKTQLEQLQEKYNQTTQEAESLRAKAELSPFANPMVEKFNQYFKENRSPEEARRFLELHTLDMENLSGEAAFRQMTKMQNPGYSQEMVDRVVEKSFGPPPADDDPDATAKARERALDIEIAGTEAKNWLKEQTASFDDPAQKEQAAQRAQQQAQFTKAWGMVTKDLVNQESELKFEIRDQKAGGDYHFGYKPKLDDKVAQEVEQVVADYAIKNNLPLTRESQQHLREYKEQVLWNLYREDFLKHMALDMYASIQKQMVQASSGNFQVQAGSEREGQLAVKETPRRIPEFENKPGNRFF